jgi:hypothetical protein
VMALKKGCGGVPKESKGGQGCGTTVKRGEVRYLNNDNGQSSEKDKGSQLGSSWTTCTTTTERVISGSHDRRARP